ncbi:MAG: DUF4302 domain-containing protein [Prevotellaceae bacterium]|nr:DUF4302 domain-containing protein [Prevotellaceae bacterium]
MKKIIFYTLALLTAIAYTSCVSEVDDAFDKSSAQRIQDAMENDKDVLTSAANGWIMEYYGSPTETSFGGYNLIMKFSKDSVEVASEKAMDPYRTVKSHYKIEQSAGDILSFDEYNELIHYFSTPVALEDGWTDGYGFEGDHEFRVKSASKDSIVLQGKKHGARVVMTPIPDEYATNWEGYLKKVKEVEEEMIFSSYKLFIDKDTVDVSPKNRSFIFSYKELNEETDSLDDKTNQICYIVTPNGVKLYNDFAYGDYTISGFEYKDNADTYEAYKLPNVVLAPEFPSLTQQLTNKNNVWWITRENLSDPLKAEWDIADAGLAKLNETFRYVNLQTKSNHFGLYIRNYNTKKKAIVSANDAGMVWFTATEIAADKVKLTFKDECKKNTDCDDGGAYYLNPKKVKDFNHAVYTLATKEGKIFTMTTDRLKKPSYIILTEDADPSNVIKLKVAYEDFKKLSE